MTVIDQSCSTATNKWRRVNYAPIKIPSKLCAWESQEVKTHASATRKAGDSSLSSLARELRLTWSLNISLVCWLKVSKIHARASDLLSNSLQLKNSHMSLGKEAEKVWNKANFNRSQIRTKHQRELHIELCCFINLLSLNSRQHYFPSLFLLRTASLAALLLSTVSISARLTVLAWGFSFIMMPMFFRGFFLRIARRVFDGLVEKPQQ